MSSQMAALSDTTELVELQSSCGLYLKPTSRINISVVLPQLKDPSQSISNWDLMERMKKTIHPLAFASIRVSKSTMEFVRFEAECANREQMAKLLKLLDNSALKVIGFYEALKVKAGEAKLDFPARHDWDAFFRDAANMDELRAGERPDTVYLAQLPVRWFPDPADPALPSEPALRRVFETFGEVRAVDIPICDPHRKLMSKTGMRTSGFSYGPEVCFEAYVQFVEYISFVKAMDTLRGMKLVRIHDNRASAAHVRVDFDRTKQLSDKSIRRRRMEREKLIQLDKIKKAKEEEQRKKIEAERLRLDDAAFKRRRVREEKRRIRALEKKRVQEEQEISRKIAMEERKLLVAERKLSSIRLLTELFKRVQQARKTDAVKSLEGDLEALIRAERKEKEQRAEEILTRQRLLKKREERLREQALAKSRKTDAFEESEPTFPDRGADSSFEQPHIRSQVASVSSSSQQQHRESGERRVRPPLRNPLSHKAASKRRRSESPEFLSARLAPPSTSRSVRAPQYKTYIPPRRSVAAPPRLRRRPSTSPPVREGGGDPFEMLLDD